VVKLTQERKQFAFRKNAVEIAIRFSIFVRAKSISKLSIVDGRG